MKNKADSTMPTPKSHKTYCTIGAALRLQPLPRTTKRRRRASLEKGFADNTCSYIRIRWGITVVHALVPSDVSAGAVGDAYLVRYT